MDAQTAKKAFSFEPTSEDALDNLRAGQVLIHDIYMEENGWEIGQSFLGVIALNWVK